jgi:hypothetical protein
MKAAAPRKTRQSRSLEPVAWAAVPVAALGVGVLASGVGIDLLVLGLGALFLLALDRTAGDWLSETVGQGPGTLVMGLAVVGCTWYFLSYASDDFFAAAENRGYRTAYYQRSSAPEPSTEAGGSSASSYVQSAVTTSSGRSGELNASSSSNEPGRLNDRDPAPADSVTSEPQEGTIPESAQVRPAQAPLSGGVAGGSRIVFGPAKRLPVAGPSQITLTLSPSQVAPARRVIFEVMVTSEGRPVTEGSVDFTVNGAGAGKVALNSRGAATTGFATHITGMYEVRARFSGTSRYEPSSSSVHTLHVQH